MRVKNHRRAVPTRRPALSRRAVIAMLLLLSAGATKAAWTNEPEHEAARGQKKATAARAQSRYVAIPLGADTELRRRGAYLARKFSLPLIAEPTVKGVVIREFRP